MALVTLGTTIRGGTVPNTTFSSGTPPTTMPAIGMKNTTNATVVPGIFHGASVAPGQFHFFSTTDFDDRSRFNPRNHNIDTVSTDGKKDYLDDVNELAKLIANGTLVVYTATRNLSNNTFLPVAVAAYTVLADGTIQIT